MKTKLLLKDFPGFKCLKSRKDAEKLIEHTIRICNQANSNSRVSQEDLVNINAYKAALTTDKELWINNLTNTDLNSVDGYSDTFEKAAEDSEECIFDTLSLMGEGNLIKGLGKLLEIEVGDFKSGVIFTQREINNAKTKEYSVYAISRTKEDEYILNTLEIVSADDRKPFILYNLLDLSATYSKENHRCYHTVRGKGLTNLNSDVCLNLTWIVRFLAFKKLATTEVLSYEVVDDTIIKSGISNFQKSFILNNQEPFIEVNYYSANWYREIICDHEFRVRGHWRMQACGKDKQDRKLVFIAPFTKNGYHRRAQKDVCKLEKV